MVTFREAVANSLRGALCAVIAVNDDGAKLFGRIPGLSSGADYFNFFAPLRAQLCNDDPADVPTPSPPFTGGQCPVFYTAAIQVTQYNTAGEVVSSGVNNIPGLQGPIGGIFYASDCAIIVGPLAPGAGGFCAYITTASGPQLVAGNGNGGVNATILTVTRQDGMTDNCGDPPIVVPPPGPVSRPINVTYNNEDNDVIDIDGDVVFSPFFSVGDLSLNVPFNLDLGGLEFSGTIEISPDFNIDLAPRVFFGGPGQPDDPDLPPSGDPNTPDDPPTDDETTVIIGVVIRSSPVGELQSTAIATVNMPTIYAPRLASCSFAIESSLTVAWTSDIDVKNRDCYIPCPVPTGAIGVSVTPMPGWECSWTPVRGRPLT